MNKRYTEKDISLYIMKDGSHWSVCTEEVWNDCGESQRAKLSTPDGIVFLRYQS